MAPAFVRIYIQRLLILLIAYALCRFLFLAWNWELYFSQTPRLDLMRSFLVGLRFDVAAILFTNTPLFLLGLLLPAQWLATRWARRAEYVLFAVINFVAIGTNFIDAEFVKFMGKRTSFDFLFLRGDLERHSLSVLATYWPLLLGLCVLMAAVLWLTPYFKNERAEAPLRPAFWLWRFAALAAMVIGMRGGFQFKPLHPMHAYFTTRHELGLLTLNTPFNLIKSRPRGELRRERYFKTDREAIERLQALTSLSRPPLGAARRFNVVIIILESISLEYVGAANDYPGFTPFIDELAQKAFFFPYNFANARRSIEGLPAVLCGLPAMMREPIITSDFANNRLDCLPKILAAKGYSTHFLHGAHNGSMHFDTFSKIAGFENFVGLNEYPKDNPNDLDKYWGVLDEPMLQYAVKTLDQAPKPALVSVFTLSSHHPYYIPPQHRGKFPKGSLEIHESVGYTDYALRRFFEVAKTKEWFDKTIFVLTSDHTQKSDQKKYAELLGGWRVPFLLYVPGLPDLNVSRQRITQHIDIMPSVLDLLGVDHSKERILVGQSVFDQRKQGRAYGFTGGSYWYIDPTIQVSFQNEPFRFEAFKHAHTWDRQPVSEELPEAKRALLDIKAVSHYMNEGLLNNSLYTWEKSL